MLPEIHDEETFGEKNEEGKKKYIKAKFGEMRPGDFPLVSPCEQG